MATEIKAHIAGIVWKVLRQAGDTVAEGDDVVVLESMKMEVPVESTATGKVLEVCCAEGETVEEGAVLAVVE